MVRKAVKRKQKGDAVAFEHGGVKRLEVSVSGADIWSDVGPVGLDSNFDTSELSAVMDKEESEVFSRKIGRYEFNVLSLVLFETLEGYMRNRTSVDIRVTDVTGRIETKTGFSVTVRKRITGNPANRSYMYVRFVNADEA